MEDQLIKDMITRNSYLSRVELAKKMAELEATIKHLELDLQEAEEDAHYYKYLDDSLKMP